MRPDGVWTRAKLEAPSWLATAGTGNVVARIAGALMAAGIDAFDAGEMAAFIHGRAAALAHQHRDAGPLTATAVVDATTSAIGQLLAQRSRAADN